MPCRNRFLIRKAAIVVLGYIVFDLFGLNPQPEVNPILLDARKVPLLTRLNKVSGQEMIIRTLTVIAFGTLIYSALQFSSAVVAIVEFMCERGEGLATPMWPRDGGVHSAAVWGVSKPPVNRIEHNELN